MQDPITLKSGATFQGSVAPFEDADELAKIVARELLAVNFDLETVNFADLSGKDVNILKNVAFQLLASKTLSAQLWKCMKRCLLDGQSITKESFDAEEARQNYYPVAWEVMKLNLRPFFKGLDLSSLTSVAPASSAPKSE
jgi:hypothetical protein